jgi:hypothetical protein
VSHKLAGEHHHTMRRSAEQAPNRRTGGWMLPDGSSVAPSEGIARLKDLARGARRRITDSRQTINGRRRVE